jgi:hypothetical protein
MKRATILGMIAVGAALLLAACQGHPATVPAVMPTETAQSAQALPVVVTAAAQPTATAVPTTQPAETAAVSTGAEGTAQAYFTALANGDFESAAAQYSNFSLLAQGLTRSEAARALRSQQQKSAARWSNLQIVETRDWSEQTALVHVRYDLEQTDAQTGKSAATAQDEWWPLRKEAGVWRYNRLNLIDTRTLDVKEQTTNGLTIKPLQLNRYSDHISLITLVQNQTMDAITLGQTNEDLATFTIGGKPVAAQAAQWIFPRLRSDPDVEFVVKGLFDPFPDRVVIRQWKNLQVPPWFDFELTE